VNAGKQAPEASLPFTMTKIGTFDLPWRIAFLPDGRMLITEKGGPLWLVTQQGARTPVTGVPPVLARGQGGMLGVFLSPNYAKDQNIYLTYAEPGDSGSSLALARAKLAIAKNSAHLSGLRVIWRDGGRGKGGQFGAAVAFSPDKRFLFLTVGERQRMTPAQDPNSPLGKILRLTLDGKPAPGNPQAGKVGSPTIPIIKPPDNTELAKTAPVVSTYTFPGPNLTPSETWATGFRTPYGLAFAPDGRLWEVEHGPFGGDELNLIQPGKNYGWPLVSYGMNYDRTPIPNPDTRPDLTKPVIYWVPVIAPGNLTFYRGAMFPQWNGSAFIGGLASKTLNRITFDGHGGAAPAERWNVGHRIRDVEVAPDGALWMIEDAKNGGLFRLTPSAASNSVGSASNGDVTPGDQGAVWPDEGDATWAPRPTETAITPNDLRTRLYQIADDSMEGRKIGSRGDYKATAYIADVFRRAGLKPAGENGTYFQNVPYGSYSVATSTARLSSGMTAHAAGEHWVPLSPSAATGTGAIAELRNVPVVFAGHFGDTLALDPARFRGKVAVYVGGPRLPGGQSRVARLARCDSLPDRFGADAAIADDARNRTRGVRTFGRRDERALAAGAVGVLFIEPISEAAAADMLEPRAGMQLSDAVVAAPAGAVIDDAIAQQLFGKSSSELSIGDAGAPVSGTWRYTFAISPTPGRNVIAIRPGSDPARAGEYVLISAHNDHIGMSSAAVDHDSLRAVNMVTRRQGANDPVCRPDPAQQREIDSLIAHARSIRPPHRDSIFNGADDDGSGTVILLEEAERFAREHPARSIIFVSHTGEEGGLLGSKWFTDHPTIALDSVASAINMDMEAKGKVWEVKFGGPHSIQTLGARRLSREYGDVIDSVNAVRSEAMAIDKSWDVPANPWNRFCRSDQVNYVLHRVPVVYMSTGYALDYHQLTDEPRYADYDHMARIGNFVHDIALAVADRRTRPAISGDDPAFPRCR
jgi:glucose/arabinose dehydrogenase/Zn-dependent M28 family amino/carboxypeptidase